MKILEVSKMSVVCPTCGTRFEFNSTDVESVEDTDGDDMFGVVCPMCKDFHWMNLLKWDDTFTSELVAPEDLPGRDERDEAIDKMLGLSE